MFNEITLICNLGKDPELRQTQSGDAVCSIWACSSEKFTNREGAQQEKIQWHSIVVWGKIGESCAQYLFKGSRIFVKGKLEYREYEKNGVKQRQAEIVANTIRFLSPPKAKEAQSSPDMYGNPYAAQVATQQHYQQQPQYSQPAAQQYPPPVVPQQVVSQQTAASDFNNFSLEDIPF